MSRDVWRDAVLRRDGVRCVVCGRAGDQVGLSAHHLVERRLWPDGGYYLDNGATVCDDPAEDGGLSCHRRAEGNAITPDDLRAMAGIATVLLPPHLAVDDIYDKWGSPLLRDGTWGMGELFWEEPVQRALADTGMLSLYRQRVKYPRTPKLSYSPNVEPDDLPFDPDEMFAGREVVMLEKMDGESCSIYRDAIHARSMDSGPHPSREWVRALQGRIGHELAPGLRLSGENMQARHSIAYENLPGYFLLFGVWDVQAALSWDEVVEWAGLLDLPTVPVIWRGVWDRSEADAAWAEWRPPYGPTSEGYVLRVTSSFVYRDFARSVAKWVRAGHVQTDQHWMHQEMVENGLSRRTGRRTG